MLPDEKHLELAKLLRVVLALCFGCRGSEVARSVSADLGEGMLPAWCIALAIFRLLVDFDLPICGSAPRTAVSLVRTHLR